MRGGSLLRLLTGTTLALLAPARAETAAAPGQPAPGDELLWQAIAALDGDPAATQPFARRLDELAQRRRALLAKAREYLAAYPGGSHRDDVVRLELRALFDIGTLDGGSYGALATRVEEYLRYPPSAAALHEAAYWALHLRRLTRTAGVAAPASAPLGRFDQELLAAYRDYLERYPHSRYVPQMAAALFEAAAARGDDEEQRWLVARLTRDFPEHPVTELLQAQQRRRAAVGQPFGLAFETAAGVRVDTAEWVGRPVAVVVWAGFSAAARDCVRQMEAYRSSHPELLVLGVNLDESPERMSAVCAELGLAWPQLNDGLGWANRFVRQWGVREVPTVFVIDRAGRLAGCVGEGWRELLARVVEN